MIEPNLTGSFSPQLALLKESANSKMPAAALYSTDTMIFEPFILGKEVGSSLIRRLVEEGLFRRQTGLISTKYWGYDGNVCLPFATIDDNGFILPCLDVDDSQDVVQFQPQQQTLHYKSIYLIYPHHCRLDQTARSRLSCNWNARSWISLYNSWA